MPSNTSGRLPFRILAFISAISGLVAVCDYLKLGSVYFVGRENKANGNDGWVSKWIESSGHVPHGEGNENKFAKAITRVLESHPNHLENTVDGENIQYLRKNKIERGYKDEGSDGEYSNDDDDENRALQSDGDDDNDDDDDDDDDVTSPTRKPTSKPSSRQTAA
jgi:hypothetical protein